MRGWLLLVATGCGRLGFDAAPLDGAPDTAIDTAIGHDEDGDGVPDELDVCPHVAGSQVDSDGDGVGNDCDFSATSAERIVLFATLQPSEQPFSTIGEWTQRADSLHFDGTDICAGLTLPLIERDILVEVGFEIFDVLGATAQHQIALTVNADLDTPNLFVELNEVGGLSNAAITLYDAGNYSVVNGQALQSGFHPGAGFLRATQLVNTSVRMQGGWFGEIYDLIEPSTLYTNATLMQFGVNNLDIEIRYVVAIATR